MSLQIGVYDHATGENSVRDMTGAEIAEHKAAIIKNAQIKAAKLAEKEGAKVALLASLNITEAQAINLGLLQMEQSTPIVSSDE